eukprot:tig00000042_g15655.t1
MWCAPRPAPRGARGHSSAAPSRPAVRIAPSGNDLEVNVSVRRGRSESVVCAGRPDKGGGTPSRRRNASGDGALVRSALATGCKLPLRRPFRERGMRWAPDKGGGTPSRRRNASGDGHSVRRGRSESVVCAGRPDKGGGTPSRRRNASGDGALVRSALATGCRSESVVCAGRPDKGGGTPSRRRNASGDGHSPFRERGMRWAARQGGGTPSRRRNASGDGALVRSALATGCKLPLRRPFRERGMRWRPDKGGGTPSRRRNASGDGALVRSALATGCRSESAIRKYQKSFDPLIAYAPFERLVRSVARPVRAGADVRVRRGAYLQVKEIAHFEKKRREEAGTFDEANLLAIHRNRITIAPKVGKRAAPAPADREA